MSRVVTLAYCLNVHPGETLSEIVKTIEGPVARARTLAGLDRIPVGLWLPGEVAALVANEIESRETLAAALTKAGAVPVTANAFPIGGFHAETVGREVYSPTWSMGDRLRYTLDVALAMSLLLPEGAEATISTVPVGFKAFVEDEHAHLRAGAMLGLAAVGLERIAAQTGRSMVLALEPEPLATFETAREAVGFLERNVFSGLGRDSIERALEIEPRAAEEIARRRIGVCLDACHHAVAFEPLDEALATYARAGVRVAKAQLSSALAVESPASNQRGVERLLAFHEPRYLHQTFARRGSAITRVETIVDAFEGKALKPGFADAEEVRSHFHVPLAWEGGDGLGTTRPLLEGALAKIAGATSCLEVETYTWTVLPEASRAAFGDDVAAMVAAELGWAKGALERGGVSASSV